MNRTYILIISGLLLFIFFQERCGRDKRNELVREVASYKEAVQKFSLKVNGIKVEAAKNKTLLLENQKQLKEVYASNDTLRELVGRYRRITSAANITTIASVVRDTIELIDSIPCEFFTRFERDTTYYIAGQITQDALIIDSLSIANRQGIVIGFERGGFLRRGTYSATVINSSPHVSTVAIGAYQVRERRRWVGLKVAAGILAGYLAGRGL